MTQPTDDLAAQMVREMCRHVLIDPPGIFDGKKPSVKFEVQNMEAIARRYMEKAQKVEAPNLCSAFRTTLAGDGKYEMTFRFRSMEAMHAADDEWRAIRNALAS